MRQLTMDLWKRDRCLETLRAECVDRGLTASDVDLLATIASEDTSRESESFCCKSKRAWGKAIGRDGNTALAAMRRLARLGVAAWSVSDEGYEILVDWSGVFELPRKTTKREHRRECLREAIGGSGEGVVRGGETAPTCTNTRTTNSCNVSDVSSVLRGAADRSCRLPAKPWAKRGGLASDQLRLAVDSRDEAILTGLYFAGVEAKFWADSEQLRIRFLACCWQAVQSATGSCMGLLTDLVKVHLGGKPRPEWLKGDGLSDPAEDWACATRREWHQSRVAREWRQSAEIGEMVG